MVWYQTGNLPWDLAQHRQEMSTFFRIPGFSGCLLWMLANYIDADTDRHFWICAPFWRSLCQFLSRQHLQFAPRLMRFIQVCKYDGVLTAVLCLCLPTAVFMWLSPFAQTIAANYCATKCLKMHQGVSKGEWREGAFSVLAKMDVSGFSVLCLFLWMNPFIGRTILSFSFPQKQAINNHCPTLERWDVSAHSKCSLLALIKTVCVNTEISSSWFQK